MNKELHKVKDHPGLYRDPVSKAIVVMDKTARENYLNQKQIVKKTMSATDELRGEINNLKTEMSEIKDMLRAITTHLTK